MIFCNWSRFGYKWNNLFIYNIFFFLLDFSLTEFLSNSGLSTLDDFAISSLMEHLGVSEYLQPNQCNITQAPYSSGVNGWVDGKG